MTCLEGGVDELEVYRGLGVPEVWCWVKSRLWVHGLGADGYLRQPRSVLLPALDLEQLAEPVASTERNDQQRVVREYRLALRKP